MLMNYYIEQTRLSGNLHTFSSLLFTTSYNLYLHYSILPHNFLMSNYHSLFHCIFEEISTSRVERQGIFADVPELHQRMNSLEQSNQRLNMELLELRHLYDRTVQENSDLRRMVEERDVVILDE